MKHQVRRRRRPLRIPVREDGAKPAAVKHIVAMRMRDRLIACHTGKERAAAAPAVFAGEPHADSKAGKPCVVEIRAGKRPDTPIAPEEIEVSSFFADSPLVRMGRLSVVSLTPPPCSFLAKEGCGLCPVSSGDLMLRSASSLRVLAALSFLAGVASLILETVWIQRFSFVLGSTAPATSIVVAVFLGGLAMGSWLIGAASARRVNPLRLFAGVQWAIGAYALLFPHFLRAGESTYGALYPRIAGSEVLDAAARFSMAFLLLAVPTILMGGTLPLLLQAGADRADEIGRDAGILNGLNTLGAASGGLLCGYVLMRQLGVRNAGAAAGLLDLVVGTAAWWFSGGAPDPVLRAGPGAAEGSTSAPGASDARWAVACFTLSGFTGIAYEMLFLRYLVLYFRDTIYLASGMIAAFILWLGIGSVAGAALQRRVRSPLGVLGLVQAGIGLSAFLAFHVPVPWHGPLSVAGRSSFGTQILLVLVLLSVPAFLMGATFPLVARIVACDVRFVGRRIGAVAALNTAGAIAGSLAAVFLLVPRLGMEKAIFACVLTNVLAGAAVVAADRGLPRRRGALAACAAGAILPFAIRAAEGVTIPLTVLGSLIAPGDAIVALREGVTGTATVVRSARGGFELWSDSVDISATRNGSFYAPGFLPALIAPRIPERVLSLAFGGGLSSYGLRLFPEVKRLDCVDLSRENMELSLLHFPENAGFAGDARARFVVDDARSFLRYSAGEYDLILVEATPPRFGFRNAFLFTREFFDSAARRLDRGGLFAQVLPLADLSLEETRGVMRTFADIFPERAMWFIGGPDVVMIGSSSPLVFSFGESARRLARPRIGSELGQRLQIAQYQAPGNLFAGILLDSAAWDRVAEGGTLYTEDRLPLLYSTGRDRGGENVRLIHERLAPWSDVLARMADRDEVARGYGPGRFELLLEDRRQYFTAHMYGPADFYPALLNYIERFAIDKEGERTRLCEVLKARGQEAEANDLAERMRRRPRVP